MRKPIILLLALQLLSIAECKGKKGKKVVSTAAPIKEEVQKNSILDDIFFFVSDVDLDITEKFMKEARLAQYEFMNLIGDEPLPLERSTLSKEQIRKFALIFFGLTGTKSVYRFPVREELETLIACLITPNEKCDNYPKFLYNFIHNTLLYTVPKSIEEGGITKTLYTLFYSPDKPDGVLTQERSSKEICAKIENLSIFEATKRVDRYSIQQRPITPNFVAFYRFLNFFSGVFNNTDIESYETGQPIGGLASKYTYFNTMFAKYGHDKVFPYMAVSLRRFNAAEYIRENRINTVTSYIYEYVINEKLKGSSDFLPRLNILMALAYLFEGETKNFLNAIFRSRALILNSVKNSLERKTVHSLIPTKFAAKFLADELTESTTDRLKSFAAVHNVIDSASVVYKNDFSSKSKIFELRNYERTMCTAVAYATSHCLKLLEDGFFWDSSLLSGLNDYYQALADERAIENMKNEKLRKIKHTPVQAFRGKAQRTMTPATPLMHHDNDESMFLADIINANKWDLSNDDSASIAPTISDFGWNSEFADDWENFGKAKELEEIIEEDEEPVNGKDTLRSLKKNYRPKMTTSPFIEHAMGVGYSVTDDEVESELKHNFQGFHRTFNFPLLSKWSHFLTVLSKDSDFDGTATADSENLYPTPNLPPFLQGESFFSEVEINTHVAALNKNISNSQKSNIKPTAEDAKEHANLETTFLSVAKRKIHMPKYAKKYIYKLILAVRDNKVEEIMTLLSEMHKLNVPFVKYISLIIFSTDNYLARLNKALRAPTPAHSNGKAIDDFIVEYAKNDLNKRIASLPFVTFKILYNGSFLKQLSENEKNLTLKMCNYHMYKHLMDLYKDSTSHEIADFVDVTIFTLPEGKIERKDADYTSPFESNAFLLHVLKKNEAYRGVSGADLVAFVENNYKATPRVWDPTTINSNTLIGYIENTHRFYWDSLRLEQVAKTDSIVQRAISGDFIEITPALVPQLLFHCVKQISLCGIFNAYVHLMAFYSPGQFQEGKWDIKFDKGFRARLFAEFQGTLNTLSQDTDIYMDWNAILFKNILEITKLYDSDSVSLIDDYLARNHHVVMGDRRVVGSIGQRLQWMIEQPEFKEFAGLAVKVTMESLERHRTGFLKVVENFSSLMLMTLTLPITHMINDHRDLFQS